MVMCPFPISTLCASFLPFFTYIAHVLILTTASTPKTMLMGHNVHTNRLCIYFALQVRLTSLSLLSKMLVKFCVKIHHSYFCTEISNELALRSYLLIPPNRKTLLFDNSETDSGVMPRILWNLKVHLVEKNMPQDLLNKRAKDTNRNFG